MNIQNAKVVRTSPLRTPTDVGMEAVRDISGALTTLLDLILARDYFERISSRNVSSNSLVSLASKNMKLSI